MYKKNGFSLIETIMVIMIISLIALVSAPLLKAAADLFSYQTNAVALEDEGNYAMARMTREMRRLRDDRSVAAGSRSNFEFIDKDNKQIRYYLSGTTIRRTEDGVDKLFMDQIDVDGLVFYFYNDETADTGETGEPLATSPVVGIGTKTDMRYFKISIHSKKNNYTFAIRGGGRLRNVQFRESDLFP